jgi:hypothetical protein
MDRFDDDILAAELRLLRPTPRPEFTAELDERAAAGFPRRAPRPGAGRLARLAAHWHDVAPRRPLFAVIGLAMTVLAVATVVVIASSSTGGGSSHEFAMSGEESGGEFEAAETAGGGAAASEATAGPAHKNGKLIPFSKTKAAPSAGAEAMAEEAGSVEGETEIEPKAEGADHAGEERPEETAAPYTKAQQNLPGVTIVGGSPARDIERSASVVLGTKPGQVNQAAAKVYETVHEVKGVVLNSSVQSGSKGATGASFSLLIPSGKLSSALAAFSQIAEVRERHDATDDITAPTVSATEELRDSNASIEGLLKELGDVETEAERESVEARLREERRQHAAIRAKLDNLDKRASMSEVSVRIVAGKHSGVTPAGKGSGGGGWSIGDALHDAGKVLTVAAGVLLIALAVLAPIALIALLIWSLNRFRLRRLRERTLG